MKDSRGLGFKDSSEAPRSKLRGIRAEASKKLKPTINIKKVEGPEPFGLGLHEPSVPSPLEPYSFGDCDD